MSAAWGDERIHPLSGSASKMQKARSALRIRHVPPSFPFVMAPPTVLFDRLTSLKYMEMKKNNKMNRYGLVCFIEK